MRPEPRVRRDKKCVQCKGPRVVDKQCTDARRKAVLADPFCNNECAHAYFGVVFAKIDPALGHRRTPLAEREGMAKQERTDLLQVTP